MWRGETWRGQAPPLQFLQRLPVGPSKDPQEGRRRIFRLRLVMVIICNMLIIGCPGSGRTLLVAWFLLVGQSRLHWYRSHLHWRHIIYARSPLMTNWWQGRVALAIYSPRTGL